MSGEIDEKINEIKVTRREGNNLHILGKNYPTNTLYEIIQDVETKEKIQEDYFERSGIVNPYDNTTIGVDIIGTIFTAGLYLIHRLKPEVRENIKKTIEFYEKVNQFKKENINDMPEEAKEKHYQVQAAIRQASIFAHPDPII